MSVEGHMALTKQNVFTVLLLFKVNVEEEKSF